MQAGSGQCGNTEREAPERSIERLAKIPGHQTQHKQQLQQTVAKQQLSKGISLPPLTLSRRCRPPAPAPAGSQRRAQRGRQFACAAQTMEDSRLKAQPEKTPAPRNTSPASVNPSAPQAIALIKLFATVGRYSPGVVASRGWFPRHRPPLCRRHRRAAAPRPAQTARWPAAGTGYQTNRYQQGSGGKQADEAAADGMSHLLQHTRRKADRPADKRHAEQDPHRHRQRHQPITNAAADRPEGAGVTPQSPSRWCRAPCQSNPPADLAPAATYAFCSFY